MDERRDEPCSRCPFRDGVPVEAIERPEPDPARRIPMLCHQSGCLDGFGPDMICEGWRRHQDDAT